jgi:hypothetical protein
MYLHVYPERPVGVEACQAGIILAVRVLTWSVDPGNKKQ